MDSTNVVKKLEMLSLPIDFKNHIFHDLGNVASHPEVIARLTKTSSESHKDTRGTYFQGIEGDVLHHFWIYQIDGNDVPQAIFIRGHEEMHALHGSGNLHLMQPKLDGYGNLFDFSKVPRFKDCTREELEIVADIGGIYSLLSRGIDYRFIRNYGNIHPKAVGVFESHQKGAQILNISDLLHHLTDITPID